MIRYRFEILLATSLALTACASERSPAPPSQQRASSTVFSNEDRRAARALSISNRPDLASLSSPYMRAIVCELAVETLGERMAEMDSLSAGQMAGFRRVQQDLARDIGKAAIREGKGQADIDRDKEQQRLTLSDPVARIPLAMGCLRNRAGVS